MHLPEQVHDFQANDVQVGINFLQRARRHVLIKVPVKGDFVADDAHLALLLRKGDLLFAGSGETKDEIGKCVAFVDDIEAYAGGDIVILRQGNADALFLGYYLNSVPVNAQKASKGQGDAVVHISASALANIEVRMPIVEEQIAIAAVLADIDFDIATLEARRDKTHALKQGMMQELLTGRIRLV